MYARLKEYRERVCERGGGVLSAVDGVFVCCGVFIVEKVERRMKGVRKVTRTGRRREG